MHAGRLYMLSGGRDGVDWVRNIGANQWVSVELCDEIHFGMAHSVEANTG